MTVQGVIDAQATTPGMMPLLPKSSIRFGTRALRCARDERWIVSKRRRAREWKCDVQLLVADARRRIIKKFMRLILQSFTYFHLRFLAGLWQNLERETEFFFRNLLHSITSQNVWALLEARAAYAPVALQTFRLSLDLDQH